MSQLDLKIGPKIKAFRRQFGLQANKLAEDLNISPSYLNLIESGKRKIDGDLLLKVCEKLNIQLSDLTTKTDINLQNNIFTIIDAIEKLELVKSRSEIKRLIKSNGIKINDELYKNSNLSLKEYAEFKEIKISIGKKKMGILKIV